MRTNGEDVSLTVGSQTVKIGTTFALTGGKDFRGKAHMKLWFRPYWPGVILATGLIAELRKTK